MKTSDGFEMFLTVEAEEVAKVLYGLGADFSSGHRDLGMQAHAMAVNVALNRNWIRETYINGGHLQACVDAHPNARKVEDLIPILLAGLHDLSSFEVSKISHHFLIPCPVFDVVPRFDDTGDSIHAAIEGLRDV